MPEACVCPPSATPGIPFQKMLHSRSGIIVMSILWGLGLATLFRKVCKDRSCMVFRKPNPGWVEQRVFKDGDQCIQYRAIRIPCSTSK